MKKERNYFGLSVGILLILFLAMAALKCCNVIDWPWYLVTAPLWIPGLIFVAIIVIYTIVMLCAFNDEYEDEEGCDE